MKKLVKSVEELKKGKIRGLVERRMKEFREMGRKPGKEIFKELCFCILTANYNAERGIEIQKRVGNGFLILPEGQLAGKLKELGYRYPNKRAQYIADNKKHRNTLKETLDSFENENRAREWLINNIRGIGYKEASHFLRNIGYNDFAIIDFHIVDVLARHGLVKKPKTLTKNRYMEIEKLLKGLAQKLKMSPAELDLYLWYMETGKVLK